MAKKALLDVLEQTIGKYVKNLDAESLNVAVWSGKIELHSLVLDVEAVNNELDRQAAEAPNLALPFKVLSGKFEAFEVDVPWSQITSRPVVLRAQGLKVEVEPYDRLAQADHLKAVVASETTRAANIRRAREKSIEASDKYRQQAYAMKKLAFAESTTENKSSFGSRLVRRIIENIQIEIVDVHISLTDMDGSAGVVLESLSLVTTDKEGKKVFIDRTNQASLDNLFLYKMLQIKGFGIYLDQFSFQPTRDLMPISESERCEPKEPSHSFILAPLSFEARLRQADSNVCVDFSKYHLSSELSSLSIILSRNQLDLARKISKEISSTESVACPLFPEYRPMARVSKETARDWWKYAIRCIGRLNGRRSWVEFFLAFQKRKKYIPLYKRQAHHASCPWIKPLSTEEAKELMEIEHDRTLSVDGLMSWRNLAESQVDREREKHAATQPEEQPKSYFSSVFRSRAKTITIAQNDDDAPIELTPDELKEIEAMSKEEFTDPELSKDSKLCDVQFILNALKINLTSYDLRHVAALDMGTVSVDFEAAANGAFSFNFDLFDLEIQDRATPNSLFPSVLRSIKNKPMDKEDREGAFNFHLSKAKSGDQNLRLKLAQFEAVASQVLFRELKRFFSTVPIKRKKSSQLNPLLAQSLSGSVDLFYDADEGGGSSVISPPTAIIDRPATTSTAVSDFSNVLFDAWKEKTETKVSWVLDVDIKAPLLIVPEKCNDPVANVLVFNLGHLQLKYGKIDPAQKVLQWFEDHPKHNPSDFLLDSGNIAINDLTFKVGKADGWRLLLDSETLNETSDSAVIDPISVLLDFGVESISPTETPRVCCFGVIPTISLRLSPSQGFKIFPVINSWNDCLDEMNEGNHANNNVQDVDPNLDAVALTRPLSTNSGDKGSSSVAEPGSSVQENASGECHSTFYFLVGLQRLSVVVTKDPSNKLEAHLVSVYASTSIMSDGSSVNGLRMGWFWILDRMQCDYPRRQRLLAHSNLPLPPQFFAEGEKYNVLEELTKQGVFERDYGGSTELADISFKKRGFEIHDTETVDENSIHSVLDASFSSLFIHWNPHAVKGINAMIKSLTSLVDEYGAHDSNGLILSPEKAPKRRNSLVAGEQNSYQEKPLGGRMLIKAKMESLDINLNSALDDFPLFVLTVSNAQVNILSSNSNETDIEASLSLGDLRMRTPDGMGQTLPSYRTLIGLAPGRTESLLTVKYFLGQRATSRVDLDPAVTNRLEAFADVELSPMRLCYIHSQVFALMEYITEGILGALTARAATSAAEAAREIANSVAGEKLFVVRATSFEALLPQAATKVQFIAIHAGSLDVEFHMFPDPGGSKTHVALSDVSLKDSNENLMQEQPIRMSIDVKLPSDQVGSLDDQAMRVNVDISEASFVMTKSQYAQILSTLDENTGEMELFLRHDSLPLSIETSDGSTNEKIERSLVKDDATAGLTHAGVEAVIILRRMYLNVKIEVLALQLCGISMLDPLVRIAAVSSSVELQKYPHAEKMACQVSLRNLVCEDRRSKASARQYRFLIDQAASDSMTENSCENLFHIGYNSGENESSVELQVGSPRVCLIPDAISEVLGFFRVEGRSEKPDMAKNDPHSVTLRQNLVRVDSGGRGEDIEATLVPSYELAVSSYSVSTKTCRIVLVDLGSQLASEIAPEQNIQLTETLVLQGVFAASLSMATDINSGKLINADFQSNGDAMEIFSAFGTEMKSPLQLLEPAECSAHGSLKTTNTGRTEMEIRAATLTPFEIIFSMHNAALLSAILNSLSESFANVESTEKEDAQKCLSPKEAERIEHLASALEATKTTDKILYKESLSMDDASAATSNNGAEGRIWTRKFQLKLTMPEARVTVVNDLQGLDEALFRFSVVNFVAGGEVENSKNQPSSRSMLFDFHLNTSVLADYFDASLNLWSKLLIKPWEITLKGIRSPSRRFNSERLSTTIDLESFPCCVSFSEQFLASLASAYRMWSIYSTATAIPADERLSRDSVGINTASLKHSMAASAARNLITSLPYAIENHCGANAFFTLRGGGVERRLCQNGTTQYFRFEPPRGRGAGGKRSYGQDVEMDKSLEIFVGDSVVEIGHLDQELKLPRRAHDLHDGRVLFTKVVREGKTTVLHLSSHVGVLNNTSLPFTLSVLVDGFQNDVGTCMANNQVKVSNTALSTKEGLASKESHNFSIPIDLLRAFNEEWVNSGKSSVSLTISPSLINQPKTPGNIKLSGVVDVTASLRQLKRSGDGCFISKSDVTCRPGGADRTIYPLVVQVLLKMILVDDAHVYIDVCLEPLAIIENKVPVEMKIRTPMPHTFSSSPKDDVLGEDVIYLLSPGDRIEVFTPGPSIALSMKTSDNPVAGNRLDWLDGGWVNLPLDTAFSLPEPISCFMPFISSSGDLQRNRISRGSEFFIAEGFESLAELAANNDGKSSVKSPSSPAEASVSPSSTRPLRTFYVTVCYYGVDHTGDILFEQAGTTNDNLGSSRNFGSSSFRQKPLNPFSAFASKRHHRRISLLPSGKVPLRIMQLTMDGVEGVTRSMPFFVEDLAIGEGGVYSTPILWENRRPSGYFAYRSIMNEHQSELHVVPEYIIFNGSKDLVLVKERGKPEIIIDSGKVGQLRVASRERGLEIAFNFVEMEFQSSFVHVDKLGLKVVILNSRAGFPIGSVCVQTVIDTQGDARLVVKIGDFKTGGLESRLPSQEPSIFSEDCFRFRVRWTELQFILDEVHQLQSTDSKAALSPRFPKSISDFVHSGSAKDNAIRDLDNLQRAVPTRSLEVFQQPVTSIIFSRFTFDFQRVFKESRSQAARDSPERTQISLIVHDVLIKDLTPDSKFPVVFDCTSNTSFFDLCIRARGPLDADLIQIDLFDLNLEHAKGISEKMILTTSESYVWRLLDLANRILAASGDFAGIALKLEEDKEHGGFVVKIEESQASKQRNDTKKYTPPKGDKLFVVDLARVSPFTLLVSFQRDPQSSRYRKNQNAWGHSLMNYFTRRLKFTIERAELNFARYEDRTLRGPPDRLMETLGAVYMSRMKFKLVTLLSASTLQDWKYLAARDTGDDAYVEGDILRATGNLAGKSASIVFKRAASGLASGVTGLTDAVGNNIERGTEKIGAGRVGAGVNSVITGVGDGVGETLLGVGSGAGKILKGAGQGIGHVFGGVAGGAVQVGKGIGKGIIKGDGNAVVQGLTKGVSSVGGGIAQGAETAVMGAADGFLSAGKGLFSGVRNVGRGAVNAVQGKRYEKKSPQR